MDSSVHITLTRKVLDCQDMRVLADFYLRLLGWKVHEDGGEEWLDICPQEGGVKLAFLKQR